MTAAIWHEAGFVLKKDVVLVSLPALGEDGGATCGKHRVCGVLAQ